MSHSESQPDLRIRRATTDDVEAIADLYAELHADEWEGNPPFTIERSAWRAEVAETLARPATVLLAATLDGRVVGTVRLERDTRPFGPIGEIRRLVVTRAWRGRGIGSRLMAEAERHALAFGAHDLRLTVVSGNRAARELYQALGWEEFAVRYRRHLEDGPGPDPTRIEADGG